MVFRSILTNDPIADMQLLILFASQLLKINIIVKRHNNLIKQKKHIISSVTNTVFRVNL